MKAFKPGIEVVCVKSGVWRSIVRGIAGVGPKYDDICIVQDLIPCGEFLYLQLCEYPPDENRIIHLYNAAHFEPLISDDELARELASVPEVLPLSSQRCIIATLCLLIASLLTSCHEPTAPVKRCGVIRWVDTNRFDATFYYESKTRTPNFFSVRFRTNRPDTVRVNDSICFKIERHEN